MTSHHVHLPVSDVLVGQVAVAILEKGQALASMHLVVGSDQWQELEQAMFTAGLVRRIPGENGERSELTPAGRALLKYYLPATGHKDESIIDKTRASKSKFGYAFGEFKVKNVPIEEVRQRLMMALDGLSAQVELLDEGALSFNS
ncbi:MAG: hypothetical protein JW934_12420, partial [Anaerolineae bacterium]|nr:hypothetical protein [Anaerolineae bacterium]